LLPVNQELIKALDALLAGLYSCFPMGDSAAVTGVAADLIACDGPVCDVERPLGDKNVTEVLNTNI
jgi:hypothetical protein